MPAKKSLANLRREATREVHRLALEMEKQELLTRLRLADARNQIVAIVKDLLPNAAALARRGRPRLLAICQKVVQEQSKPTSPREQQIRLRVGRE